MCVALIGGMDRLKRDYESAARKCGVTLKTFTGKESCLVDKMGTPDMTILLTNMISHNARTEVLQRSKALGVPVRFLHSCGVSSVRQCLSCIMAERKAKATTWMCAVKVVGELNRKGMRAYEAGDVPGAEFLLHQALLQARGTKSAVLEAKILNNIGLIEIVTGRRAEAAQRLQAALEKVRTRVGTRNKLHTVLANNLEKALF